MIVDKTVNGQKQKISVAGSTDVLLLAILEQLEILNLQKQGSSPSSGSKKKGK